MFRRCIDEVIVVAVVAVVVVVVDAVHAFLRRVVRCSVFRDGTTAVLIQELPVRFRLEPEHFHLVGIHFARIFNDGYLYTGDACAARDKLRRLWNGSRSATNRRNTDYTRKNTKYDGGGRNATTTAYGRRRRSARDWFRFSFTIIS